MEKENLVLRLVCAPLTSYESCGRNFSFREVHFGGFRVTIAWNLDYDLHQGVMVSVSVLTLSVISVERWYAICHPLKFKTTTTRVRMLIVIIWILAILLLIPDLVVLDTVPRFPNNFTILLTSCKPLWEYHSQMGYELFKMIALFFLPLCLMGCTYGQIVRCLWSVPIPTETTYTYSSKSNTAIPRSSAETQLIARRKAAKMLIAVVVMFGICYLPVHLLNILRYATLLPDSEHVVYFPLVAHWLCYFNSAINPVIYNFMSEKFQKAFRNTIFCCEVCYPEKTNHSYIQTNFKTAYVQPSIRDQGHSKPEFV